MLDAVGPLSVKPRVVRFNRARRLLRRRVAVASQRELAALAGWGKS